jgi:hypothetical protein
MGLQEAVAFKEAADAQNKGWWADYSWQSPYFAAVALLKEMNPEDTRYDDMPLLHACWSCL